MAQKEVLITTPDHDDTTDYISKWSIILIEEAEKTGFRVTNLKSSKATKKEFESRMKNSTPSLIILNGHGDKNEVQGYKNESLLKTGDNDHITKETIVYARSCQARHTLGKSCIRKGTRAFVGYDEDFLFFADPGRTANPLKDEYAAPCFVSSNLVPLSLLKGNTAKEAVEKSKEHTEKLISLWKTKKDAEAPAVIGSLIWNKISLGAEGDKNAKV